MTYYAANLPAPFTIQTLQSRKGSARKITALTAYDFTTARLLDLAGIDLILVGDSLSSVFQGLKTTLPVTLDEMLYHSRCVTRGVSRALVVGDMPFMSYQVSPEEALKNAGRFVKEAGVGAVKLEGGVTAAGAIAKISSAEIPVIGHVGLTPQSYLRMGGHRVQGKSRAKKAGLPEAGSRERIIEDALRVQEAGAAAVVIEGVPRELAAEITKLLEIPTIGIGAGPDCDGQILVTADMLGLTGAEAPKFVKQQANLAEIVTDSVKSYMADVQNRNFPGAEHSYCEVKKELKKIA